MNLTGALFVARALNLANVRDKYVIEVGSRDIRGLGSVRPFIEALSPTRYVGVDVQPGPGVDRVVDATNLLTEFGPKSFDVVVSTELLEHVADWQSVISNIKNVCRPGGIIVLTTRSRGYRYHGAPHDYWRFELEDMYHIFSDCVQVGVARDILSPGVFVAATIPAVFHEICLTDCQVYNLLLGKRIGRFNQSSVSKFRLNRLQLANRVGDLFSTLAQESERLILGER